MGKKQYIGVLTPSNALQRELARVETRGLCREMARAARASMERAGVQRLHPKLDPWSAKGSFSSAQAMFATAFTHVLDRLKESQDRPLELCSVKQNSSAPSDPVLLNIWYYLSVTGHLVQPKVTRAPEKNFIVQLIAVA